MLLLSWNKKRKTFSPIQPARSLNSGEIKAPVPVSSGLGFWFPDYLIVLPSSIFCLPQFPSHWQNFPTRRPVGARQPSGESSDPLPRAVANIFHRNRLDKNLINKVGLSCRKSVS